MAFEKIETLHRVTIVWDEMTGELRGASREEFRAFRDDVTGEMQAAGISDPAPVLPADLAGLIGPGADLYAQLSAALAEITYLRGVIDAAAA